MKLRSWASIASSLFDRVVSPEHHTCVSSLALMVNKAKSLLCGESQGEKQWVFRFSIDWVKILGGNEMFEAREWNGHDRDWGRLLILDLSSERKEWVPPENQCSSQGTGGKWDWHRSLFSEKPEGRVRGSRLKMSAGVRGRHLCTGPHGDYMFNGTRSIYTTNIF